MAIEKIRYQCPHCLFESVKDFDWCTECKRYHHEFRQKKIDIDNYKWVAENEI